MEVTEIETARLAGMAGEQSLSVQASSETWRPVRGDLYEVSDLGHVRNARTGRVKAQQETPKGYRQVGLYRKDRAYVHRLVAEAFLGVTAAHMEVNHIDGDKGNNRASNLEWVTHSDNQRHAFRVLGTLKLNLPLPRGERNCAAKLTDECVALMRVLASTGLSQRELGTLFGVGQSAVSNILARRTWKHV